MNPRLSVSPRLLMKNIAYMMGSELMSKLSRLVTLFVFAAYLSITEYGVAMLALVCHDLIRVFTRQGIGAKVIQCDELDLSRYVRNAQTLQWAISLLVCALQVAAAGLIAHFYASPELKSLLQLMALSYLCYPIVAVRVFLLQRSNNLKYMSFVMALCISTENIAAAIMVMLGCGLYGIAIAKVLAAVLWVLMYFKVPLPFKGMQFCIKTCKHIMSFSGKVLLAELTKMLRFHLDTLIAGRIIAPELFGLYSFAKSSGLGLSQSLSTGFVGSFYPYLCNKQRFKQLGEATKTGLLIVLLISAVFVMQAAAAPFYIPFLFGEQWLPAVLVVSILCLSAIPALYTEVYMTVWRVKGDVLEELKFMLCSLLILVVCLLLLQPMTNVAFAVAVLVANMLYVPALLLFSQSAKHLIVCCSQRMLRLL